MSRRSSLAAVALALAPVVALASGCSRTTPEPTPTATIAAESAQRKTSSAETTSSSRCVAKWSPATPAPSIPPPASATRCPPDPEPNQALPAADVQFLDAKSDLRVHAELAKSSHDVERGLMYRRAMGDDQAMLFKLDGKSDHMFWMHNTCIPLDMMFIDDDGFIVGIVEGAEPLTDSTRSVGCPSLYVLEVNGGWSRKHGVAPGQKIAIPAAAR